MQELVKRVKGTRLAEFFIVSSCRPFLPSRKTGTRSQAPAKENLVEAVIYPQGTRTLFWLVSPHGLQQYPHGIFCRGRKIHFLRPFRPDSLFRGPLGFILVTEPGKWQFERHQRQKCHAETVDVAGLRGSKLVGVQQQLWCKVSEVAAPADQCTRARDFVANATETKITKNSISLCTDEDVVL